MLTVSMSMPSSHSDARNVSDDDRNNMEAEAQSQSPSSRRPAREELEYQTTSDGDVVYVQPSFDDGMDRKTPPLSPNGTQTRSPDEGGKVPNEETRNRPSPARGMHKVSGGHVRNLSAHFFDATSLNDRDSPTEQQGTSSSSLMLDQDSDQGRKHRRIFSNDFTNPNMAHRRINSRGAARAVRRTTYHQREDSQGLDILSAAVDASKDELAAAVGASTSSPWDVPIVGSVSRPSLGQVSTDSYGPPPPPVQTHPNSMHPPPHRRTNSNLGASGYPSHPGYVAPNQLSYPAYSNYPPAPPPYYTGYQARPAYPVQYSQHPADLYHKSVYSPMDSSMRPGEMEGRAGLDRKANHQGSQTFITTVSVGPGNKTLQPTHTKDPSMVADGFLSQAGHHRKMSSFSSIGTIFGSFFNHSEQQESYPSHHRKNSSTVSFLKDIDVAFDHSDDTFLRNLHASNSGVIPENDDEDQGPREDVTSPQGDASHGSGSDPDSNQAAFPSTVGSDTKLASGGTSKRIRRKCTVQGCANRVVQGGLCISHGAKRKTCKHPGCNKNVKKAGLCSTHGPARKRCEAEGCQKVAVQGGRCIAHGAKKKLCIVDGCQKQAILSGMCKKHHDQSGGEGSGLASSSEMGVCQEIKPRSPTDAKSHKPTHTRGLSIFQEMSADAVQSLLNETASLEPVPNTLPLGAGPERKW